MLINSKCSILLVILSLILNKPILSFFYPSSTFVQLFVFLATYCLCIIVQIGSVNKINKYVGSVLGATPSLTFLLVAAQPVGQPVAAGRDGQHEGEAHEERCIVGQRSVGVGHLAGLSRKVGAAAGGVAHGGALSCWTRGTER